MEAYRRLIGDNIRKQRELLHLTQEELAHQIGKDPSYIGRVERGSVNATIDNILRIARGLQVEPALLFQSDQPDRLRDYIPDVELSTLDPTQRHMSLVILKVLNMVVNQAEPGRRVRRPAAGPYAPNGAFHHLCHDLLPPPDGPAPGAGLRHPGHPASA